MDPKIPVNLPTPEERREIVSRMPPQSLAEIEEQVDRLRKAKENGSGSGRWTGRKRKGA